MSDPHRIPESEGRGTEHPPDEEVEVYGETEHGDRVDVLIPAIPLRDWFAGQVMAGLAGQGLRNRMPDVEMARDAYTLADAMLAEREKETP